MFIGISRVNRISNDKEILPLGGIAPDAVQQRVLEEPAVRHAGQSARLRDGQQVCLETHPFAGGTGGFDSANCANPVGGWLPGTYETQIFVGEDWKVVGRFIVQGNPPKALPTVTSTATRTPTRTPAPSSTPVLTQTPPLLTSTP